MIHIIQRYGLTEDEALLVESVLIDAYSLENLSNKISGHGSFEPTNAKVLMKDLALSEFGNNVPPFMIIKVKDSTVTAYSGDRYEATRQSWKFNPENAKDRCVISVINGVVRAVYKVEKWVENESNPERYEFIGKPADKDIEKLFINKRIPAVYVNKGAANPVQYSK